MLKRMWVTILAVALSAALVNCGSNKQPAASQQSAQSNTANTQAGQPSGQPPTQQQAQASQPPAQQRAQTSSPAASAPRVETYVIPAGTALEIRLNETVSSGTASAGMTFRGTLAAPLVWHGQTVVAPTGSAVEGQVVSADRGGRLHHPAELVLTLTSLTLAGGNKTAISTHTWAEKAHTYKKRNAELIGGGAGVGALVGALAGRGKGALVGAAAGAGAGTAGAAFTGKKQIVLGPETRLRFVLSQLLTLTRTK